MMRAVIAALLAALVLAAPAARAAGRRKPAPDVSAPSAIVMEASTGDVLYQRDATERRPIASTTKLMTALLTMERSELSDIVPASDYIASPIESKLGLRPGEKLSVADLLRGLMLESANDAAVTLGEHVAGSTPKFVKLMNRRARAARPRRHALHEPDRARRARATTPPRATSRRLAITLRKHSFVRKIADRRSATLSTGRPRPPVANRNTLLGQDRWVNGLKTGHTTQAGYVLVGTRTRKNRVTLVSVVLGTSSVAARDRDSLALLRWGAGQYRRVRPGARGHRDRRGARDPLPARRPAPARHGAEQADGASAPARGSRTRTSASPRSSTARSRAGRSSGCARSSPTAS